jgi:hypothetical protein
LFLGVFATMFHAVVAVKTYIVTFRRHRQGDCLG